MPAGGPFTLTITGKTTLSLTDILVGDVWLCSGQSNMEWPLAQTIGSAAAISASAIPGLRLFTVTTQARGRPLRIDQRPKTDTAHWVAADPKTTPPFSGVAFYFGRELRREQGVPVGLINASLGGTRVEQWTPQSELEQTPVAQPILMRFDTAWASFPKKFQDYRAALDAWYLVRGHAAPDDSIPPPPPFPEDPAWQRDGRASALYNGMIAPLVPYAIRGVLWYQGEYNTDRAYQYRTLLPVFIHAWRTAWQQPDLPFLIVQLPNLAGDTTGPSAGSQWAELREAQWMTTRTVPKTGMAVTIDIGGDLHPPDKLPVGQRLFAVARALVYGEKNVVFAGPAYESMRVEGNTIRLHFASQGSALVAKGDTLKGFAIAGADRTFVWGDARIEGTDILVSSPAIATPVAVRYAWANNPAATLYNAAGFPAVPFRTDDWPGETLNAR
jgi:sialate O-acetylesterase